MQLQGKRLIVTGSARGMGAATLRAYVAAGADVTGMDFADELGASVAQQAHADGPGSAGYLHVDIADKSSIDNAFSAAAERLGGLDGLAHPAAIHRFSVASDVSVKEWDQMFAINVRGTTLTNQAAHRYMKADAEETVNRSIRRGTPIYAE